jgi:hypothetical protein
MLSDRLSRMLTAYVDGELTAHQSKSVLRLLRRSPEARTLLRQLQEDAGRLRQLPQRNLAPDVADLVIQRIAITVPKPTRYQMPTSGSAVPVSWGLAAAAAVLLAVGLGSYFLLFTLKETQLRNPIVDPSQVVRGGLEGEPGEEDEPPVTVVTEAEPKKEIKPQNPPPPAVVKRESPKPVVPAPPLTTPVPKDEDFERPDIKLSLVLEVRELDQEKGRQQLQDQLRKAAIHRVELTCLQPAAAMERLQAAFKSQGIHLLIDDFAQSCLKLRVGPQPRYALYAENVTSAEVSSILQQLNRDDRKTEASRRGPGMFEGLIVSGLSFRDHQQLRRLLGVDPTQAEPPKRILPPEAILPHGKNAIGVDIRKPISAATEEQVVRALKGQAVRRPMPEKSVVKPERLAIVVAAGSPRSAKSQEIKHFLDNRKERQPGTMQLLLILRGKN